jgi:hypothetical protein
VTERGFKPPKRPPSQRGHLDRLVSEYAQAHGMTAERVRRWLSVLSFIGALERVRAEDSSPRFLIKGGVSMELRLGLRARTTKDVDIVFRGEAGGMLDALDDAFERPYGHFRFRRKGPVEDIRDTGSRRVRRASQLWRPRLADLAARDRAAGGRRGGARARSRSASKTSSSMVRRAWRACRCDTR